MTREEMLDALDNTCDSFDWCSGNRNGTNCPLCDAYDRCPIICPESLSDAEVKLAYDIMFDKSVVKPDTTATTATTVTPVVVVKPEEPIDNPVTHPSHYTQGKVQCIEAMESAFGKEAVATWAKLNAFKYIWREEHKNGLQDIDKAIWYLNKYKELKTSG